MTGADELRGRMRRRALAEGWRLERVLIAETIAETLREDGTHALRSVEDTAHRLGLNERTVRRHRTELIDAGVFTVRRKGGRGRGADVLDIDGAELACARTESARAAHRSPDTATREPVRRSPAGSTDDHRTDAALEVSAYAADRRTIGGQSPDSATREGVRPPSPSPASWLAQQLDVDEAIAQAAYDHKAAGQDIRFPMGWAQSIPLEDWRPIIARHKPAARRVTAAQCSCPEPHERHRWEHGANLFHCAGE